jgi:xylan 1,4-beta-xylosidase
LQTETLEVSQKDGETVIKVDMPPQAVAAIRFDWRA